jgi:hypothetical protein
MKKTAFVLVSGFAMACSVFAHQAPPVVTFEPAPPQAIRVQPSPAGSAATQVAGKWAEEKPGAEPRYKDGKWITVTYSRPILKGRQAIFGSGAEFGKKVSAGSPVWRAGANQTTRFKTEAPLVIAGKTILAGEYSLFVELKEGAWSLILSTQPHLQKYDPKDKTATWGSDNYDPKFDLVKAPMKVSKAAVSFDQFTIGFVNMTQESGTLAMLWDKEMATVDFKVGM